MNKLYVVHCCVDTVIASILCRDAVDVAVAVGRCCRCAAQGLHSLVEASLSCQPLRRL